jgi:penicillin amidase
MIPFEKMPHVENPSSGFLANWNNKPVSWWSNGDTPVWGRVFRNTELLAGLTAPKLSVQNVENAAWTIARRDEFWRYLEPELLRFAPQVAQKIGYDGWDLEDSTSQPVAAAFVKRLREELFSDAIGGLVSPAYFEQALQPSFILQALEGKSKFNFLAGRSQKAVLESALNKALEDTKAVPKAHVFSVKFGNEPLVPYMNRGTFIQVVEFRNQRPLGRSVNMPGVAESGPHAFDQVPLGRAWIYKPMRL